MMGSDFLPSEQVKLVSSRAKDWLIALQKHNSLNSHFTLKHAFQILVGLWICDRALTEDQAFSETRSQGQKVCQGMVSHTDLFTDLLHSDPALVLLSTGILRFLNVQNVHLEFFAEKMSQLLQGYTNQNDEEANELFLPRFLLQRLHLHPPLQSYSIREMPEWDFIQANETVIKSFITDITAATHYGQITLSMEKKFMRVIGSILPIVMMDSFRLYNLELGMQLLRCMRYLNLHECRNFSTCLDFLIAQQQLDGRFGFLAHEITQLQLSKEKIEADLNIYLPHTVSFLWTIAEGTTPHFILTQSF